MLGNELFGVQGGHASSTSTGNSLSIPLVLNITSSKDALNAGVCGARDGLDVAILVHLDLTLDEGGGRVVTDGVEEAVGLDSLLLAGDVVLDNKVAHEAVIATLDLGGMAVETHSDLGVGEKAVGHGTAGTEDVATDEDGDMAGVLGKEGSLLSGRVTTADDEEGLVSEDGDGTVAHGAGRDTVLPVLVLTGEVEAASRGTGSDDDGIGGVSLVGAELGGVLEGAVGEVEGRDGVGNDLGSEALGLRPHVVLQSGG